MSPLVSLPMQPDFLHAKNSNREEAAASPLRLQPQAGKVLLPLNSIGQVTEPAHI